MDDVTRLDATAQAELVRNGQVAALELVDAAIARIERLDAQLNAVILRRFERVREEARAGLPAGPFRGVPFLLHYVASKGAVLALTRALARELGNDNVLVNSVAPGFTISDGVKENPAGVDFEQISAISIAARTLKRDQFPEDLVAAAVFLCSPGASFVTGQTIVIDGGQYFH